MKVLFPDIDGVCNSRAFARHKFKTTGKRMWLDVDPGLVKHVRRIIKETGCDVVLSSTWRLYPEAREVVKRDVCHFIDVTPDLHLAKKREGVNRGYEIKAWLDKHRTVRQYAILDDDADFFPGQWLFKTEFNYGITEEIADAVIAHLNAIDRRP